MKVKAVSGRGGWKMGLSPRVKRGILHLVEQLNPWRTVWYGVVGF